MCLWITDVMKMLMAQRSSVKPLQESAPSTYLRKWRYYLPPLEDAQTTQNLLHILPQSYFLPGKRVCLYIQEIFSHCMHSYLGHIYFCAYHLHMYMFNIHAVIWFSTENMHGWQYQVLISVKRSSYKVHRLTKENETNPYLCEYA